MYTGAGRRPRGVDDVEPVLVRAPTALVRHAAPALSELTPADGIDLVAVEGLPPKFAEEPVTVGSEDAHHAGLGNGLCCL
jgi:hypothetical protein